MKKDCSPDMQGKQSFLYKARSIFITGKKAQNVNKQVNKIKINVNNNHWNFRFRKTMAGKAVDIINGKA